LKAPTLRFKTYTENWFPKLLKDICSFSKGKGLSKADLSEEGLSCILYGELYTKYNAIINEVSSRTNKNIDSLVIGKKYDVLIPSSGETAIDIACASSLNVETALIGGDLNILKPNNNINGHFLSLQINGKRKHQLSTLAQGATVVHLYADAIGKLECYFPSNSEQEKIVSFFNVINQQIQLQKEKIDLLKEQKKGYIQKIFSQELRFKDELGQRYPEWKPYLLTQVVSFFKGKILSKKDLSHKGQPCVLYGQLYTLYEEVIDEVESRTLNTFGFKGEIGDVLVPSSGETSWDIACASTLRTEAFLGGDLNVLRPNKELVNGDFLAYLLSNAYKAELSKLAQGATIVHLYNDSLKSLCIQLPTLIEQKKIANMLFSIDLKIKKQHTRVAQLELQKQSLMQHMFI
jgi:type I restriction enzyme, S subunit